MLNYIRKNQSAQFVLRYMVDFLQHTDIAWLQHLAHRRLHWSEFIYWILMCVTIGSFTIINCVGLQKMFIDKSVCIDGDLNRLNYKTSTPAFTFCPEPVHVDNISEIQIRFDAEENRSDAAKVRFMQNLLLRTTIGSTERIPILNTKLSTKMLLPKLINITEQYAVSLNGMPAQKLMTDLGICYNFHSQLYSAMDTSNYGEIKAENITQRFKSSYDDFDEYPLEFAFVHNFTGRVLTFVHAQDELPSIWTKPQFVIYGQTAKMQYKFRILEVHYKPDLIRLTNPDQRRCYAPHESSLEMFPQKYSRNLCLMNCRALRAIKLCGCIPHYYAHKQLLAAKPLTPICNPQGLNCIGSYATVLRNLMGKESFRLQGNQCKCLPNCGYMLVRNFQKEKFDNASAAYNLKLRIENPSPIQLRRRLCYAVTDFLVALGSLLSFITGCSLLSFIDIFYFCTLRLFWYRRGYNGAADINY